MKEIYTTLFDSHYLAKGVALCRSIEKVCTDYIIYIFAFDTNSETILRALKMPNTTIISLQELENYFPLLRTVKPNRNAGEYCWTCKGPSIQYIFDVYNADNCAYLDADLYFYQSPKCILNGCKDADVVLTPHNFQEKYDLSDTNGYFCAQYLWFRNNKNGRMILNWWTDLCIDWCYGKHEPGKFGDQKYLERFSQEWSNVMSAKINGCCAPWNIGKFDVCSIENNNFSIVNNTTQNSEYIICYHFHFLSNTKFDLFNEFTFGPYVLDKRTINSIYIPYIRTLINISKEILNIVPTIDALGSSMVKENLVIQVLHYIKNKCKINKYIWR